MSRTRSVLLALVAALTLAACGTPTAPAPASTDAPSFNTEETPTDSSTTGRGGFQTGHG